MPLAVFERVLDQFADLTQLHLQGLGEPLMHPEFFAMVRYAARRGIEVSTNSNLTVLSARRAAECVASGLARIYVSIDGATAQTYERIRVRARFERVLRNVRRLLSAHVPAQGGRTCHAVLHGVDAGSRVARQHGAPGRRDGLERSGYRDFRNRLASALPPAVCRSCSLYHGTF